MAVVMAVLSALAAIPKIAGYVEQFASWIVAWYVGRQKAEMLTAIANAAAIAANAKTDKDRIDAAIRWRDVLSRPRVS